MVKEMRIWILPLLALLMGTAYAFNAVPVFTSPLSGCAQLNASFIRCGDGKNVSVGVTVTAPSFPAYGNYTVAWVQNNSAMPVTNIVGGQCIIPNGQTEMCFIEVPEFSVFTGNGTANEIVQLRLAPVSLPQDASFATMYFSVQHYLNASQISALDEYQYAFSQYTVQENEYAYSCGTYKVCNASVSGMLSAANTSLRESYNSLLHGSTSAAYGYASYSSAYMNQSSGALSGFAQASAAIIDNIMAGNADLASAQSAYGTSIEVLQNCTYSSSETAAAYLSAAMNAAHAYPAYINESASSQYLYEARSVLQNSSVIIASCGASHSYSPPLLNLQWLTFQGPDTEYLLVIVVAVIAVLVIRSRVAGMSELRRIRGETHHDEEDSEEKLNVKETFNQDDDAFIENISKKDSDGKKQQY